MKTTSRNTVALAIGLGGNLREVFKQIEESISDEDESESERGVRISEESNREVALPALVHGAIKRDLQLDLPEVSDVLLREMLVPGDPEEARDPQGCAVGEVLTLYTEPLRQVCSISRYPQPSS